VSVVTAVIMIGNSHPNDTGVDPQVILKLWEGDRATWTTHRLDGGSENDRVNPSDPNLIARAGCELAAKIARKDGFDAVWISVTKASTMNRQINECGELLQEIDLYICQESGSRIYSRWKNSWVADGILA
jgi:hypothetical protein